MKIGLIVLLIVLLISWLAFRFLTNGIEGGAGFDDEDLSTHKDEDIF